MIDDAFALLARQRRLLERRSAPHNVPFTILRLFAGWEANTQLRVALNDLYREAQAIGAAYVATVAEMSGRLHDVWSELGTDSSMDEAWKEAAKTWTIEKNRTTTAVISVDRDKGVLESRVDRLANSLFTLDSAWKKRGKRQYFDQLDVIADHLRQAATALNVQTHLPPAALARIRAVAALAHPDPPQDASLTVDVPDHVADNIRGMLADNDVEVAAGDAEFGALAEALTEDLHDLLDELEARLGTVRSRRLLVARFAVRAQLYDRSRLTELAGSSANKGKVEQLLRDEFARYLFDAGLSPLTEVPMATTRSDLLDLSGPPVLVEAKQYATGTKSALLKMIARAHSQAVDTVGELQAEHRPAEAFILIFRRGGGRLVAPAEPIRFGSINYYLQLVDLSPSETTGSGAKHAPIDLTAEDIFEAFAAEDAQRVDG